MPRKILHIDLDAFFCAVEEHNDPSLRGKAFAVGGRPDQRGVVASCSYAARKYGVRSAIPMSRALRLCPGLRIVPSHHRQYSQVSEQVMERLYGITSQVEQVSIDEAFLDVSDLPESGEEVARRLQSTIRQELDLPCSLGVATNKLVAKIANDTGKHRAGGSGPPCAITVVSPGEEATFLAPLPTQALWGVGPKTAARLAEMGIHNIGDIASAPEKALVERFGKNGRDLTRRAHGTDDSPIVTSYDPKSFSQETTFASDLRDGEALRKTLSQFSQGVSEELKHHHRLGGTVRLKLRWPDFTTLTRQAALSEPTDQAGVIFKAVVQLFEKVWKPGMAVRLIGVGVSHLTFIGQLAEKHPSPLVQQLSLFDAGRQQAGRQDSERQNSEHQDTIPQGVVHQKEQLLNATLEELRQRFGEQVIQRGKKPKP